MYVFCDTETTGLDPNYDELLEIGFVITDDSFQVLNYHHWVLPLFKDEFLLSTKVDPYVIDMHTRNNLWVECEEAAQDKTVTFGSVLKQALAWLEKNGVVKSKEPMCGSTIGFDRSFLAVNFPELNDYFHYRSVDVTSFRIVCENVYDLHFKPSHSTGHRTVVDCFDSIDAIKFYTRNLKRYAQTV